jgi:hypothetical protein
MITTLARYIIKSTETQKEKEKTENIGLKSYEKGEEKNKRKKVLKKKCSGFTIAQPTYYMHNCTVHTAC